MAGKLRRKGKPYDPSAPAVHNRMAKDLLRNAMVAPIEVDDPYQLGDKIVTLRSLRDDVLGRMHARKQIDEAQYHAGREFQGDFEIAERGPQAIDPSKECVDGGKTPEPITDSQIKAVARLNRAERRLGQNGSALIHAVLIRGQTMEMVCISRGLVTELEIKYIGRRFRECLEELAVVYGFAMPPRADLTGTANRGTNVNVK